MMAFVVLLFAVCVLYLSKAQGSSDVTTVFVQKGKDLRLDVKKPVVLGGRDEFRWKWNNSHNILRLFPDNKTRIIGSYVGRAEVSLQNHSLLLKNVQQNDSGDYTALIIGDNNQRLAEYKVIIQDPVSPVNLSVDSVSNSIESCNLTVSCRTERSHISSTFGCDTQTCYQKGGEQSKVTTSGSTLRVYLLNDSIFCNHSNQVSWKEDLKKIRTLCPLPATNWSLIIIGWIGIGSGCSAVVFCLYKGIKWHRGRQLQNQNATEDAPDVTTISSTAVTLNSPTTTQN